MLAGRAANAQPAAARQIEAAQVLALRAVIKCQEVWCEG